VIIHSKCYWLKQQQQQQQQQQEQQQQEEQQHTSLYRLNAYRIIIILIIT
jgi:hypothetical protein